MPYLEDIHIRDTHGRRVPVIETLEGAVRVTLPTGSPLAFQALTEDPVTGGWKAHFLTADGRRGVCEIPAHLLVPNARGIYNGPGIMAYVANWVAQHEVLFRPPRILPPQGMVPGVRPRRASRP